MGNGDLDTRPHVLSLTTRRVDGPTRDARHVAAFDRTGQQPDAIAVVDTDPDSAAYGEVVGWTDLPHTGDELHHFGWNACDASSDSYCYP